jgi:hypothetical protein
MTNPERTNAETAGSIPLSKAVLARVWQQLELHHKGQCFIMSVSRTHLFSVAAPIAEYQPLLIFAGEAAADVFLLPK